MKENLGHKIKKGKYLEIPVLASTMQKERFASSCPLNATNHVLPPTSWEPGVSSHQGKQNLQNEDGKQGHIRDGFFWQQVAL